MNAMINKIVQYQIENALISKEDAELYIYAYVIFFEDLFNMLVAIVIGAIFNKYLLVLGFLCSYVPLRRYAGGYHAKNGKTCACVSACIICGMCLLEMNSLMELVKLPIYFILAMSEICIYLLVPVDSKNKRLEYKEKQNYRKSARKILLFQIFILVFGLLMQPIDFIYGIIYSHIILSIMLWLEIIKNNN